MSEVSPLREQVEQHPQYKKLSPRAVRLFEKHKSYAGEIPLASTKGVRQQSVAGSGRGFDTGTALGKKGYLLLTDGNLYWLGLRGSWDVSGLTHLNIPQQFFGAKTRAFVPGGGVFRTRHFRAVHLRRFLELNNLQARLWESTRTSAPAGIVMVPSASDDVADQIAKLAALKEKGHITTEEYDRKKSELLDRL